jgi:predicted ATPase
MLVVLTVREGDPRGRANSIAAAADDSSVHRMGLSALNLASVTALVRAELGPAATERFCSACWELAGGNPLYVRELLAAVRNEGLSGTDDSVPALRALASSAVGASVLGRLARLGPDAVSLAQALAVLGAQTEVGVAAELASQEPAAAELTADGLAAAQILAPARPLDFFHPLIGEAVYADLALGARRLAHRRAAAILDRGRCR